MVWLSRTTAVAVMLSGLLPTACSSSSTSNAAAPTAARCALSLSGTPPIVDSSGGSGTVTLALNRECAWSAKPDVDWIAVSPASGQGDAQVSFSVASNPQPVERKGAIAINEQRLEVTQRAACAFTVSPLPGSVVAEGARLSVTVTTAPGCAWHAVSQVPWIVVSSGASGAGPGTVVLEVRANAGAARTGEVLIAGVRLTVAQAAVDAPAPPTPPPAPSCEFSLSTDGVSLGAAGGTGSVGVTAPGTCDWTARSAVSWLTVTSGANGTGNGTVRFTASANAGSSQRTGTLTIAGLVFTVTQNGAVLPPACTYSVSSTSESVDAGGEDGSIDVTAPAGCAWTAASSESWLTVTSGASGTGNGTVQYSAAANTDTSPRTATLTIAGQSVTVTQAAAPPPPCTFTVSPTSVDAPAAGDTGDITITASASSCEWEASASPSWITLTGSTTGTGSGTVAFSIAENTATTARTGTITIETEEVDVSQEAAAPTTATVDGVISALQGSCPALTFVVDSRTVHTTSSTDFQGGACASIADGDDVTVEGVVESDNSITATSVRKN
jgi:hypothetical protein